MANGCSPISMIIVKLINSSLQALTASEALSSVIAVGILIITVIHQCHCDSSVVH